VGELAEGAGECVVGLVVCVVLEVVALPDLVLAVAAVGFVVYEVDLSEESICLLGKFLLLSTGFEGDRGWTVLFLVVFELADHFEDYMQAFEKRE
jgi:hypothetical protein